MAETTRERLDAFAQSNGFDSYEDLAQSRGFPSEAMMRATAPGLAQADEKEAGVRGG